MPLAQLDPAVVALLDRCKDDTAALARLFMAETFSRSFSAPHQEIFDLIDRDPAQKICILAPRGIGKTTILSKPYLARQILFRHKKHIVYISKSQIHAIQQMENLKFELLGNTFFSRIFGDIKSDQFSKESWITSTGTMVVPKGAGQQIRGLNFRSHRPDLIVIDDLEDPKEVLNEELRKEQWIWLNSDVLNSVDRGTNDWKIVVIGTLLHEDSVLAKLMESPGWKVLRLSICDPITYESLWPEMLSTEQILKMREEFRADGLADVFAREYMNDPVSRDAASFQAENFKYYAEDQVDFRRLETVILVDPAKSVKPTSDYSAVVGVAIDPVKQSLYVRDFVMKRLHPDELYAESTAMALRLGAKVIGLEVTSLNEFILHPFKTHMHKNRQLFELIELKARGKKESRIASLIPYYRQGHVFHNNSGVCRALEDQLLSFPRSRYDDGMDALAYIVEMLEVGGRYFSPTAMSAVEADAYRQLEKEDYAEEPLGDWALV